MKIEMGLSQAYFLLKKTCLIDALDCDYTTKLGIWNLEKDICKYEAVIFRALATENVLDRYRMVGRVFWGIWEGLRAFSAFVLRHRLPLPCPHFTTLNFKYGEQEKVSGNQTGL